MGMHPWEFEDWEAARRARRLEDFLLFSAAAVRAQTPDKKVAQKRDEADKKIQDEIYKELLIFEEIFDIRRQQTQKALRAAAGKGKFKIKKPGESKKPEPIKETKIEKVKGNGRQRNTNGFKTRR